jgi:branched-chain amino acid transport system ATP-binding protein
MEGPLLRVSNVETAYHGRLTVLRGVSLEVEAGQIVTILGSNGAGKTTLLKTVMGFIPDQPDKGTVEVFCRRVNGWDPEDVAALGVAYIPEGRGSSELTVKRTSAGRVCAIGAERLGDAAAMETRFPILQERRRQGRDPIVGR